MDDIKKKIDELVNKIKGDKDIFNKFQSDPIKTVESLLNVDLPDEKIKEIVEGIKLKLNLDNNKIIDKIKGLFK